MEKKIKRLLSLILTAVLVITNIPVNTAFAGDETNDTEALTEKEALPDGEISWPEAAADWYEDYEHSFVRNETAGRNELILTKYAPREAHAGDSYIVVPGTTQWSADFAGDNGLVAGEELVTVLRSAGEGDGIWSHGEALLGIKILSGVRCEASATSVFAFLKNVETLDLSGLDTSETTSMMKLFYLSTKLKSLDLSGLDTSKVTDMSWMFEQASALADITFGTGFDTSRVTKMNNMFLDCFALTDLDLSSFNTSQVTSMKKMFSGCGKLSQLTFGSGFNTSSVTDLSSMFAGCSALTSLDVSSFDTSKAETMALMFANCSGLTSLTLGDQFSTQSVTGYTGFYNMFAGCSALPSLDVSTFTINPGAGLSYMFLNCASLTELDLRNWNMANVRQLREAFSGCTKLESILFPESFENTDLDTIQECFKGCSSLRRLDLRGFDLSKVNTDSLYGFLKGSGIQHLYLSANAMKAFDITSSGNLGACPLATVYYAGTAAEWEALGNTLGVNPSTEKQVELVCEYTGAMQPLPGPGPNPVQHITEVTYNRAEGYVHCKYNGTGSFYGIVFLNSKDFGLWDQVKETEETEDGGIQLYMDLLKNGTGEYHYYQIWENGRELRNLKDQAEDADDPNTVFNEQILNEWIESKTEEQVQCVKGIVKYTRPSKRLPAPKDLKIVSNDDGVFLSFSDVEGADPGYFWVRSRVLDDNYCETEQGHQSAISNHQNIQWLLDGGGNRQVFAVSAYPLDCEAYVNSEWSEWIIYDNGTTKAVVPVSKVTMAEKSVKLDVGKRYTAKATVGPAASTCKTVEWSISDPSICRIYFADDTGAEAWLEAVKPGTVTLTATAIDGSGVKDTMQITVNGGGSEPGPGPVEPSEPIPGSGEATDPQPVITKDAAQSLTLVKGQKFLLADKDWKLDPSAAKGVVSVSKGNVTAKKAGTVTLKRGSGENEQTIALTVLAPVVEKTEKTLKLEAGAGAQLSFSGKKVVDGMIAFTDTDSLPVRFVSAAPDVATVDGDGNVSALTKGNAAITAYINGVAFKFTVKVSEQASALTRTVHLNLTKTKNVKIKGLSKTEWVLAEGETEGIVDIIKGSKVKALKPGTVTLVCGDYKLNVIAEDPSISGSSKPYSMKAEMKVGETKPVSLTAVEQDVFFKSSKGSVAYMDAEGVIHARSKGKAKLSAKVNGRTVSIIVTVK